MASWQQIFSGVVGTVNGNVIGNSAIGNRGSIVTINGQQIQGTFNGRAVPTAASLKLVALDEAGNELVHYVIPVGQAIHVEVTAPTVEKVETTVGNISIHDAENINTVSTTNGDISLHAQSGRVNKVSTVNGSIELHGINSVGSANTVNGSIRGIPK